MNELEATRAKLKCLEMVEGTKLKWWKCVRRNTIQYADEGFVHHVMEQFDDIEFALGVVEGKPVWEGDELYYKGVQEAIGEGMNLSLPDWSWNPPKPKTVMVELTESFVRICANENCIYTELGTACRKALEGMR